MRPFQRSTQVADHDHGRIGGSQLIHMFRFACAEQRLRQRVGEHAA